MMPENQQSKVVQFVRSEYYRLVGYARRLIRETAEIDGEDIVQEVILNLFNLADITVPIDNLSAYLYRSLRNRVIDYFRKETFQMVSLDQNHTGEDHLSLAELIADPKDDALSELGRKEAHNRLFGAIEMLNDNEKQVILATEFEGRSFKELSEELNVPLGTLLSRKSRALDKLRRIWMDLEDPVQR